MKVPHSDQCVNEEKNNIAVQSFALHEKVHDK